MKFSRKLTHAVVAIACIGMVVPQAILAAPRRLLQPSRPATSP